MFAGYNACVGCITVCGLLFSVYLEAENKISLASDDL